MRNWVEAGGTNLRPQMIVALGWLRVQVSKFSNERYPSQLVLQSNADRKAYSGGMAEDNRSFSPPFKAPFSVVAAVFVLTFIVWIFFYLMKMPLHAQGTTVVAATMFGLVSMVKWVWLRTRTHRRGGEGQK